MVKYDSRQFHCSTVYGNELRGIKKRIKFLPRVRANLNEEPTPILICRHNFPSFSGHLGSYVRNVVDAFIRLLKNLMKSSEILSRTN
jgi:hypothetical protein